MAKEKQMAALHGQDPIYLDEVFEQLIEQELERKVDLVSLKQVADIGMQEGRIFYPDVAVLVLNAQTGEVEHVLIIQGEVLLELHQRFLLDLLEQLLALPGGG